MGNTPYSTIQTPGTLKCCRRLTKKDRGLVVLLISQGSFSNDDSDGNEADVKKAKQQVCTCTMHFCTFLYRPCTTTTWKCLIASFMEDVNKRRRISFSRTKVERALQEINSREIRLHLPFSANGINATVFEKQEFLLKETFSFDFHCRCCRRC